MNIRGLRTTLILGCAMSLAGLQGCAGPQGTPNPSPAALILPPKPILEFVEIGPYLCYDQKNTRKLGRYILDLRNTIIRAGDL